MSVFDRHLNPLSPAFLVALVLAGIVVPAGRAAAQPGVVTIKVMGNGDAARNIQLMDRGTGICRSNQNNCPNWIEWKWTVNQDDVAKKVIIKLVNGTFGAETCLLNSSGVPTKEFEITWAAGGASVTATVAGGCPEKSAWIYEVSCEKDTGAACATPIDPGAIIG
ncbi:MAG: hypothetical protein IH936_09690 [Acidobacteria bacterium]|nr:hypothetical protein [Acidobacteriota bacterium]